MSKYFSMQIYTHIYGFVFTKFESYYNIQFGLSFLINWNIKVLLFLFLHSSLLLQVIGHMAGATLFFFLNVYHSALYLSNKCP